MSDNIQKFICTEERGASLTDYNEDTWTFDELWMPGNTNTPVAYVCKNGKPYKTTDGRGNHRGHLMFKDADGVVNIVHGHQSQSKGAACIEGRVNRMCRREDAQQGETWNKGWQCVWTNVPVDVLTVIRLRYGRELHQ